MFCVNKNLFDITHLRKHFYSLIINSSLFINQIFFVSILKAFNEQKRVFQEMGINQNNKQFVLLIKEPLKN